MKSFTQLIILITFNIVCAVVCCAVAILLPMAGNWMSWVAYLVCLTPTLTASILGIFVTRHINRLLTREIAADHVNDLIKKCEALDGDSLESAYLIHARVEHHLRSDEKYRAFGDAVGQEILARVPEADERTRLIDMAQLEALKWTKEPPWTSS